MKFTVDGLKKLKNDLEKKEPTNELTPIASGTVALGQGLEIVGKMPPTLQVKAEPKKSWAATRPPSATLWPAGPSLLSHQMREQRLPLTIKQHESTKQQAAKLQLGQTKYTSAADVSLAASKLYASAIQKAQQSIKVQDQNLRSLHTATFIQANYMQTDKYSTPHRADHEQKSIKKHGKRR